MTEFVFSLSIALLIMVSCYPSHDYKCHTVKKVIACGSIMCRVELDDGTLAAIKSIRVMASDPVSTYTNENKAVVGFVSSSCYSEKGSQ